MRHGATSETTPENGALDRAVLVRSTQLRGPPARAQEDANLLVPSTVPLPDRSYDWNLPEQPNRPWLQMPHFEQSPFLPDRIQFNAIPKANLLPENLRPRDLVEPALTLDSINEKQDIMPPHLLDEPLTPAAYAGGPRGACRDALHRLDDLPLGVAPAGRGPAGASPV